MNRPRTRDPRADAAWLAAALQEQAHEHEADLHRIDARLEHLTAAEPRRSRPRRTVRPAQLRLIGIPLGILAAVATATVAVGVSLGITARTTHPSSQAAPSTSPHITASNQPTPETASSAAHPAGTTSARSESSPTVPAGPLTATGTVDSHSTQYWAQEDLTITTTHAIRGLHVVVAVSGGSSVQSTGWWSTILSQDIATTVSQIPGGLVYDITLGPGQTLQPTTYGFGFQFNRPASGHNFTLDTYTITATTIDDAAQATTSGAFAR
jgi:hypothetical protein